MDTVVTWKGGLAFDGVGGTTGNHVALDTKDAGSGGLTPVELILVALGGCTGMDVISILQKKQQDVTDLKIRLNGQRAEDHPRVFTHIEVEYIVTGHNVDRNAVERAVELSAEKYCTVEGMLKKAAVITNKITVLEAETA